MAAILEAWGVCMGVGCMHGIACKCTGFNDAAEQCFDLLSLTAVRLSCRVTQTRAFDTEPASSSYATGALGLRPQLGCIENCWHAWVVSTILSVFLVSCIQVESQLVTTQLISLLSLKAGCNHVAEHARHRCPAHASAARHAACRIHCGQEPWHHLHKQARGDTRWEARSATSSHKHMM